MTSTIKPPYQKVIGQHGKPGLLADAQPKKGVAFPWWTWPVLGIGAVATLSLIFPRQTAALAATIRKAF